MNAELARKRIASYMRGNITRAELDEFIDGFGDDLTEEAYAEFLMEEFEKFVAAENSNEPHPENKDASEAALQTEQKKGKSTRSGRFMYMRGFSFCMKVAASFLSVALCNFKFKYLIVILCSRKLANLKR